MSEASKGGFYGKSDRKDRSLRNSKELLLLSPLAHSILGAYCSLSRVQCSPHCLAFLQNYVSSGGGRRAWTHEGQTERGCGEPDGGRQGGWALNYTSGKHLANLICILTSPFLWLCLSPEGYG